MLNAVLIMGGLGVVVGIGLAVASKIFYVYVDPKVLAVDDVLPGANCGGCGYPGCTANAEAVVAGKSPPNSCVAAGIETAEAIAAILGVSVEAKEPDIARPGCTYGLDDADVKYRYDGLNDCRAAAMLSGGMKVCTIGCIGLGTCAKACPFDAIVMGDDKLPKVIESRCTGCGTCEKVCPKNIINLSSVTRRIIREYTTENCTTPCQRTCPAGIDICAYIGEIDNGNYERAVQIIKERNPFPAVIGRICPRPCENECRRKLVDEPVAINFLKRFAADYEIKKGKRILPYKAPDTGKKIAVVGGGAEGLSAAFFSARLGHQVTLYEATDKLGGLLRSAISANRLPHKILDWDIEGVLEMGVKAETGKVFGKDLSLDSLLKTDVEAVFLASGGWDSRLARGAGSKLESPIPGTYLMVDYARFLGNREKPLPLQEPVILMGGGALALNLAEKLRKSGVEKLTLLFRETPDELGVDEAALDALRKKDVTVVFHSGITRLLGEKEALTAVEHCDLMTGARRIIPAGTLILAAGRYPELIFTTPGTEADDGYPDARRRRQWEAIPPYKQPDNASEKGFFAKGDAMTDFSGAIVAIAAGRRAAASLHKSIYDLPLELPETLLTGESAIQDVDHVDSVKSTTRNIMPVSEQMSLLQGDELETGFTENAARAEAKRCLQCGLICYLRTEEEKDEATASAVSA